MKLRRELTSSKKTTTPSDLLLIRSTLPALPFGVLDFPRPFGRSISILPSDALQGFPIELQTSRDRHIHIYACGPLVSSTK